MEIYIQIYVCVLVCDEIVFLTPENIQRFENQQTDKLPSNSKPLDFLLILLASGLLKVVLEGYKKHLTIIVHIALGYFSMCLGSRSNPAGYLWGSSVKVLSHFLEFGSVPSGGACFYSTFVLSIAPPRGNIALSQVSCILEHWN